MPPGGDSLHVENVSDNENFEERKTEWINKTDDDNKNKL